MPNEILKTKMNYAYETARAIQTENIAKGGGVPDRLKHRLAIAKNRERFLQFEEPAPKVDDAFAVCCLWDSVALKSHAALDEEGVMSNDQIAQFFENESVDFKDERDSHSSDKGRLSLPGVIEELTEAILKLLSRKG